MEITMRAETSDISTVNSASSSENAASSSNEVGAENLKRKRNQSSEDLSKKPKLGMLLIPIKKLIFLIFLLKYQVSMAIYTTNNCRMSKEEIWIL